MCSGSIWRESGTHVEDRRVASIVSIGIESLADVAGGFVYIDLTALFRQTLREPPHDVTRVSNKTRRGGKRQALEQLSRLPL
jgi:hypothetical protein